MTVETPARPDRTSRELEALMEEARRRARRRRFGYAAGVVALLLAGAVVLLLAGGEAGEQGRDEAAPRSSAATGQSGLLFVRAAVDSEGGAVVDEGVFAIDLSTGEAERVRLRFNCGDTPFCLISTGGELVVSSVGRTTAYNPAARGGHQVARVGEGWITVPSTTDGRVWLGILASGKLGGPHRRGLSAMRETDLEGNVIRSMRPPKGQWPVGAVGSGLLFEQDRGMRLWSFDERGFTIRIPGVAPAAASASLVASRGRRGSELLLTDTRTGQISRIPAPAGYRWMYEGAFTPDGSHLALPVARVGEARHTEALAVVDIQTRAAAVVAGSTALDSDYGAIAWSSDGDRLFFAGEDGTVLSYGIGSDGVTAHAKLGSDDSILEMVSVRPRD